MKNQKGKWYEGVLSLGSAVLIALTIRWGIAEAYVIPSGSMQPTLLIHDHIFVNKLKYGVRIPFSKTFIAEWHHPQRGEIVVFKDPKDNSTFLIKRVVAIAGDKISYQDNQLTINGEKIAITPETASEGDAAWLKDDDLERPVAEHDIYTEKTGDINHTVLHEKGENDRDLGEIEVPPKSFFAMGDHRDNSSDSRFWGFVPEENILGTALVVWLSCEEGIPGINMLCNPATIRWTRFFHNVK